MLIDLPLIMSNGTFKSLKTLDEAELEAFIRYLMEFLCEKDNLNPHQKPIWWSPSIPFPIYFLKGSSIPYVRNKRLHMRKMIKTCYTQRGVADLLNLSENLSKSHSFQIHYLKNPDKKTITVYKDGSPVVIVPEKNINYDYKFIPMDRIPGSPDVSIFTLEKTVEPEVTVYVKYEMAKKSTGGKKLQLSKQIIELEDSDPDVVIIEDTEATKMDDDDVVLIEDSDDDCIITNVINLPKPKLSPQKNRLLLSKRKHQNNKLNEIHYSKPEENIFIQNMKLLKKKQIEQQKKRQEFLNKKQLFEKKQIENDKKRRSYLRNRQLLQEKKQQKQQQQQLQQQRKSVRKRKTTKTHDLIVLSEDEEVLDKIISTKWLKQEKKDKETTQDSFLSKFDLAPRSSPKITTNSNTTNNIMTVEKERITNNFFSKITDLSMIPLMVNIGMIPKKCLTVSNPLAVEKRSNFIENLTNKKSTNLLAVEKRSNLMESQTNKKSVQYPIRSCSVVVEKLSPSTILRLTNKKK